MRCDRKANTAEAGTALASVGGASCGRRACCGSGPFSRRGSGGKSPAGGTAGDGTPAEPEIPADVPADVPEEMPWTPVQESEPVDDSYFDDVAFVGDSRTDGFRLYSGLERGTYFCVTGETVASATDMENWKTEDGRKVSLADAVAAADCGKIYLMLGINELGWNGTDIFRSHAENLLRRLQADHPDAEIVVQSLLPVSAEQDAKAPMSITSGSLPIIRCGWSWRRRPAATM